MALGRARQNERLVARPQITVLAGMFKQTSQRMAQAQADTPARPPVLEAVGAVGMETPVALSPSVSPVHTVASPSKLSIELAAAFAQLSVARANLVAMVNKCATAEGCDLGLLRRARELVTSAWNATAAAETLQVLCEDSASKELMARALASALSAVTAVNDADAVLTACFASAKQGSSRSVSTPMTAGVAVRQDSRAGRMSVGSASANIDVYVASAPSPIVFSRDPSTVSGSFDSAVPSPGLPPRSVLADLASNGVTCVVQRAAAPTTSSASSSSPLPPHPLVSFMSERRNITSSAGYPPQPLSQVSSTSTFSDAGSVGEAQLFECFHRDLAAVTELLGVAQLLIDTQTELRAAVSVQEVRFGVLQ